MKSGRSVQYGRLFFLNSRRKYTGEKGICFNYYDIVDNAKRVRLAKFLQGYGFRVQKSAFEALISFSLYNKLLREIGVYVDEEDSIRIYKIVGQGQVTILGKNEKVQNDDCIII